MARIPELIAYRTSKPHSDHLVIESDTEKIVPAQRAHASIAAAYSHTADS